MQKRKLRGTDIGTRTYTRGHGTKRDTKVISTEIIRATRFRVLSVLRLAAARGVPGAGGSAT
jgi:hypothetical protein